MKDELFYEAESKTARPHKYSIKYKQEDENTRKEFSDVIYPTMVIRSQAETIELQEKEIERLNNIINELEKDIDNEIMMTRCLDKYNEGFFDATLHYKNKLKELKEGK